MQRGMKFKWSEEEFSLREFTNVFSRHLPITFRITEGWMGRNEQQTFSADEIYRIGAVKQQRRILTEHGSGYYVSIPIMTRKKVDLFFPYGKVDKSVSMEHVSMAMKSHARKTVSLMFENDNPVSFSFGPDMGANVNLGKMNIVDVYNERYLVGHSLWDTTLIDRGIPISIPVYMDMKVSPAVGLDGGTDKDFRKVLVDIEEQMVKAVTEVDVYEEIMLFPRDTTSNDYEYVRPVATFAKATQACKPAVKIAQSVAYSGQTLTKESAWKKVVMELSQTSPMSPTSQSRASAQTTNVTGAEKTVPRASDKRKAKTAAFGRVAASDAPALAQTKGGTTGRSMQASPTSVRRQGPPTRPNVTFPIGCAITVGTLTVAKANNTEFGQTPTTTLNSRNVTPTHHLLPRQECKTIRKVQQDVSTLNVKQLADRLQVLKIPDPYVKAFIDRDVDGDLLTSLDEEILIDEFTFTRFYAIKLMKHIREGYFPTIETQT